MGLQIGYGNQLLFKKQLRQFEGISFSHRINSYTSFQRVCMQGIDRIEFQSWQTMQDWLKQVTLCLSREQDRNLFIVV